MVVLNILRRQKEKLLGPQVTVNIKEPYDEENLPPMCGCGYCTPLFLILTVALMFTVICTSGVYLYDEYRSGQTHRFQGWCNIPIDKQELMQNIEDEMRNTETLHEDFEIFMDEERASIDVPDFRDGRGGRFIHDFGANITGIIDVDGKRCFIMPLNRSVVLPPRSLIDMIHKMDNGYYDVNINLIKQNMMAVLPALEDYSKLSIHIIKECLNFAIYELEKVNKTVVKRSADSTGDKTKFMEFAGNFLQEIDIVNLNDLKNLEEGPTSKSD